MSIFTDNRTGAEWTEKSDDLTVNVAKVGGGTIGRRYDGAWLVEIVSFKGDAPRVILADMLTTGTPKTHREAALEALAFLPEDVEVALDAEDADDELEVCECCALVIANGDDSGCRDFYGHTHPAPNLPGAVVTCGGGEEETCGPGDRYGWTCAACGQEMEEGATAHRVIVL